MSFLQLRSAPPPVIQNSGSLLSLDPASIATFVGASLFAATLSITDPAGAATLFSKQGFISAGSSTTSFVGASIANSVLASGALASPVSWTGASIAQSVLTAPGTSPTPLIGGSLNNSVLSASGVGSTGLQFVILWAPAGTGTATFVGASQFNGVLSAAGAGTANVLSTAAVQAMFFPPPLQRPYVFGPGGGLQYQWFPLPPPSTPSSTIAPLTISDPVGTAAFVGASLANGVLQVLDPVGTASFPSLAPAAPMFFWTPQARPRIFGPGGGQQYRWTPQAAASAPALTITDALGTAAFVGSSTSSGSGVLSATGVGTATFLGTGIAKASWSASGGSIVLFTGASTVNGVLAASGSGTALWTTSGALLLINDPIGTAAFVGASQAIGVNPFLVTDQQLLNELQYAATETPNQGASWPSNLWTVAELSGYLTQRQNQILYETGAVLTRGTLNTMPNVLRYALPQEWIQTRRATWMRADGTFHPLLRSEVWYLDYGLVSWEATMAPTPLVFMDDILPTLQIQIAPAANDAGQLQLLFVALGTPLSNTGVALTIPPDFVPILKWGVLADMFSKVGRAHDPERAAYCEDRFVQGIALVEALFWGAEDQQGLGQ